MRNRFLTSMKEISVSRRSFLLGACACAGVGLPRVLSAAAPVRTPEVTVVPGFFAGGGRMYCLSNHGVSQMLGTVFVSPQGRVVVVDGGEAADGEALGRLLQSLGGVVSRWFITHNHDDHWGALYGIMMRDAFPRWSGGAAAPSWAHLRYSPSICLSTHVPRGFSLRRFSLVLRVTS